MFATRRVRGAMLAGRVQRPVVLLHSRQFHPSITSHTTTGYGDPQDEKIENNTPTPKPASSTDPHPDGQGKGPGTKSGSTDPEVGAGKVGSAGGAKGAGGKDAKVNAKEMRETKKVGEDPKHEEVGGAGVTGG